MHRCPMCDASTGDAVHVCARRVTLSALPDPRLGVVVAGKYRIETPIGVGTSGAVYQATQLNLHRQVALKLIRSDSVDDEHIDRLELEALTVARLRHPNVISIIDFGVAPNVGPYLVMEMLDGRTLKQELVDEGPMAVEDAVALIGPVCEALEAAHEAGIIHRDLKPANLFLLSTPAGRTLKILDFGIAVLREINTGATTLPGAEHASEHAGSGASMVGTPLYMSPEQCNDEPVDARSDIYSLGCVLYEMITGRPPFVANSVSEVLVRQRTHEPLKPSFLASGAPPWLDDVVLHALAKDPANRFQTAAAFARALVDRGADLSSSNPTATACVQTNLQPDSTPFIGRTVEVAEIAWRLTEARFVTLIGPGGIGKTRLAREAARVVLDRFPDGVWLVELARLNDPALVPALVAQVLGIREEPSRPLLETICDAMASRALLMVLDNCEHVIEACAELVAALLQSGSRVRVLATSREIFDIEGEAVWSVPPLPLPSPEHSIGAAQAIRHEAVRLFVNRAQTCKPSFTLSNDNAADIVELCHVLEGIPLAIELAAARMAAISVKDVLARMDDRFRLLQGSPLGALPRHRTLRAALDWSFDLLLDDERALLLRLSVFAGGFSLEAAEDVCAGGVLDRRDVFDALRRLVNKSLVSAEEHSGAMRYRMLETVRQYAREKLFGEDEETAIRLSHCEWCIGLAKRALDATNSPRRAEWYQRLESEHDNLREALRWSVRDLQNATLALRLASALYRFWSTQGFLNEGRSWLESALALDPAAPANLRADAYYGLSFLGFVQAELQQAEAASEDCIAIRRRLDDRVGLARALTMKSMIVGRRGHHDVAYRIQQESLALSRSLSLDEEANHAVFCLGLLAMYKGAFDLANEHFVESLGEYRSRANEHKIVVLLHNLGEVAWFRHKPERAVEYLEECLTIARKLDSRRLAADTCRSLARAVGDLGDVERAYELFSQSLDMQRAMGNREGIVEVLEGCACVAAAAGADRRAVWLAEAAAAARREHNLPPDPGFQNELDRRLREVIDRLSVDEFREARTRGRDLALDAAVALALAERRQHASE